MTPRTVRVAVKGFVTVEVEANDDAQAIERAVAVFNAMDEIKADEVQADPWNSEVE